MSDDLILDDVLPEAECRGPTGRAVTGCAAQPDDVRPGDVYVETDASAASRHTAWARGAAAIVTSCDPGAERDEGPIYVVPDVPAAHGRICHALAGDPSRRLRVVAILGSAGKTTSACLTASVLESAGARCALWSSLGVFDGEELLRPASCEPATLATWLARAVAAGCTHAVLEISQAALARQSAAGISFDVAAVTEMRHDLHNLDESADAQRSRWLTALDQLALDGFALLNADDPDCCRALAEMHGPVLSYGFSSNAEISASVVERHLSEQTFLLMHGTDTAPVRTTMAGDHNVRHALLAAAVGAAYGIELPRIVRGIEAVRRVPGRLERLECGQPFGVFVDEADTPERLGASLAALRTVSRGRLICVCGVAQQGGAGQREAVGHVLEKGADLAVLCGASEHQEIDAASAEGVLRGFRKRLSPRVIRDRASAIRWALREARDGDVVLLAGRGSNHYGLVDDGQWPANDREVARRWLYEQGAAASQPLRRAA